MLIVERHHPVVQQIGCGERGLAIVEFGEGHLGRGVDERLLVDASDPLQGADVERVLRPTVAGALALELPVGFLIRLSLLHAKHRLRSLFAPRIELLAFGRLQAMGHGLYQGWMVRRRPGRGEALVQAGMMMLPARGDQGSISAAWQTVTFAALK